MTLTYTLTVTNAGGSQADGVSATQTPPGVTFLSATSATGSCTLSGSLLSCAFGTVAAAASDTASVQVRADVGGVILISNAEVDSTTADTNTSNNNTTLTTAVIGAGTRSVWAANAARTRRSPHQPRHERLGRVDYPGRSGARHCVPAGRAACLCRELHHRQHRRHRYEHEWSGWQHLADGAGAGRGQSGQCATTSRRIRTRCRCSMRKPSVSSRPFRSAVRQTDSRSRRTGRACSRRQPQLELGFRHRHRVEHGDGDHQYRIVPGRDNAVAERQAALCRELLRQHRLGGGHDHQYRCVDD